MLYNSPPPRCGSCTWIRLTTLKGVVTVESYDAFERLLHLLVSIGRFATVRVHASSTLLHHLGTSLLFLCARHPHREGRRSCLEDAAIDIWACADWQLRMPLESPNLMHGGMLSSLLLVVGACGSLGICLPTLGPATLGATGIVEGM